MSANDAKGRCKVSPLNSKELPGIHPVEEFTECEGVRYGLVHEM